VPTECEVGFLLDEHPFLTHYLTGGDPCSPTGSTGSWNAMTGSSGGWQDASFDLSAYAGKQVEVSIAYVTDPGFGVTGAFVDDTRLVVGGTSRDTEGFESGLGPWTVTGPPPGSSPHTGRFTRSRNLFSPVVTTRDTALLGFGVEQAASPTDRTALLARAFTSVGLSR
jgi:hypothetical protein